MKSILRPTRLARWAAVVALSLAAVSTTLPTVSKWYFEAGLARQSPAWVSEALWHARKWGGYFLAPPTNDEMIAYFRAHEGDFERLATRYYELVARYYDDHATQRDVRLQLRYRDIHEAMKFQLAELGIAEVTAGGPGFTKSVYGQRPFQVMGMKLYLFDQGGNLASLPDARKAYAYAPRLTDQNSVATQPISHYLNTLAYFHFDGRLVPKRCDNRPGYCCGLAEISANWAATTCRNSYE